MEKLSLIVVAFVLCFSCKEAKTNKDEPVIVKNTATDQTVAPIKIIPIAHATAILEWGDITIYIDPVGGAAAFESQRPPDLILITDIHGDHFSLETLQGLHTEKAKVIVPQAVADKIPSEFTPQLDVLFNGEHKERFGIAIEAVPMYNLRDEAKKFHTKGRGNGYVITIENQRIYFSGDTEDIPEMRSLKDIDKAFICMNLPYTMTEERAADAVLEFQPAQVYPYHYRGRPNVSDVQKFKELVHAKNMDIDVVQLDWYPSEDY